jgi:hypothetical protein
MLLIAFAIVGFITFLLLSIFAKKLRLIHRLLISFGIFMFLSIFTITWIVTGGDRPSSDATTVYSENCVEKRK